MSLLTLMERQVFPGFDRAHKAGNFAPSVRPSILTALVEMNCALCRDNGSTRAVVLNKVHSRAGQLRAVR